jgi:hypothetical protein
MPDNTAETQTPAEAGGSVVDQILHAFLTKVEAEDGLRDVGGRLRKALLETREDSEAALKAAMFGGTTE